MENQVQEKKVSFRTKGGLEVQRCVRPLDVPTAMDEIKQAIDTRKGCLFVSNYEVPNRYARWDIGFIDPPLELLAQGEWVSLLALNGEGYTLLGLFAPFLRQHPHFLEVEEKEWSFRIRLKKPPTFFPEEERQRQPGFFSVLRCLLDAIACGEKEMGFYGAFGYDLVFQFEHLQKIHPRREDQIDAHLYFPTRLVTVDWQRNQAEEVSYFFGTPTGFAGENRQGGESFPLPGRENPDPEIRFDHTAEEFREKVEKVRQAAKAGDVLEVVLSQSFSREYADSPSNIFQRLCQENPSPYSFLIHMGREVLVGASPEMYVRVSRGQMETSPISGTVPRGDSPMETADQIKHLISSEKEESELTMCTDVDRNDMNRVCIPGSVQLIGRRLLETYSRLVHTVDHLAGKLEPNRDAVDAFISHLWACTVTGAPKPRAMQMIEEMEKGPRGWYGGAVGFFRANGSLNSGMTLRTVQLKENMATVRAGATLLFDSDPETEEKESRLKASAFLQVIQKPEEGGGKAPPRNNLLVNALGRGKRVLLIDFRDSFSHTLASYLRMTGAEVVVVRKDFPDSFLGGFSPDLVVLSPGPGRPEDHAMTTVIQRVLAEKKPVFGVCLGHQGLGEYFGARLAVQPVPAHGKSAEIFHRQTSIFQDLPSPFEAGRYHSIFVERDTLPDALEVLAETKEGMIMAFRHRSLPLVSVQFHPESILSMKQEVGFQLVENLFRYLL